jgi:hypothetical protein
MLTISTHTYIVLLSGLWLSAPLLHAQELGHYPDARLGSSLLSVAGANGLTPADAKVLHQRPALIHSLELRSPRFLSALVATDDRQTKLSSSRERWARSQIIRCVRLRVNFLA